MTPQEIVTYGAGVIALAIFFGIYAWRAKKDGSLDDRVMKYLDDKDDVIRQMQKYHNEREEDLSMRTREVNDRLYKVMGDAIQLATTHGAQIMAAVETVRRDSHDTAQRLHMRLEQTNEILRSTQIKLEDCEASHAECKSRMDRVEAKIGVIQQE